MGTSSETRRKEMEIKSNEKIAAQNLAFQKEKLAYDQQLQQQIFNREDTAYSRTVKDMRAAGISPLAMQGTNAAGEVIQTTAPQNGMVYDYTSGMSTDAEKLGAAISAIGQISGVLQQVEQTKSIALQNEFARQTMSDRVNQEFSNAMSRAYDSASKAEKYFYNNRYGINDNMTPEERYWAIYSRALGLSEGYEDRYINSNGINYKVEGMREFTPAYERGFSALRTLDYGIDKIMDFIPKLPKINQNKK